MTDPSLVTPVPGKPHLLLGAFDIGTLGYVAEEFFVSGTASSYTPTMELGPDGRWDVTPSGTAEYTTRIVVLTPADGAQCPDFNGTVLVEWLNVSGGIDAPAVWMMAHREILRAGYAYVAVSAQRVGVEGGASLLGADMSLKTQDPARYAPLRHPGDAVLLRHLFPDRRTRSRRRDDSSGRAGRSPRATCGRRGRIAIGDVPDDLRQRRRSARPKLRRLPGAFAVRVRPHRWTAVPYSTSRRPRPRRRSRSAPTCASRSSRSSPRPTCSAVSGTAITSRDSPTTNGCGSGRSPAPHMPTTTRSRWRRSTAARRRSMPSWRPTRRPTC